MTWVCILNIPKNEKGADYSVKIEPDPEILEESYCTKKEHGFLLQSYGRLIMCEINVLLW